MKQIQYLLIVFLIVACANDETNGGEQLQFVKSNCFNLPKVPFDLDAILEGVSSKRSDSLWSNFWMSEHVRIIEELNGYRDGENRLFPYSDFDSTIFVFYEQESDLVRTNDMDRRAIRDVSVLCQEKANLLLNVVNDPLNYSTGESGTVIPFSQVTFYLKKKKVGELTFSNNYSSISSLPENTMIFGDLNSRGDSLLDLVKPWD